MYRRFTILAILAIGVILVGYFLYQEQPAIYAALDSLKLVPQPERFTELYFKNPSSLPRAAVAQQPISFAFTIHNAEGATTVYSYEVHFDYQGGGRTDLATGTVLLVNDASATIPVYYTFQTSNPQGRMVVDLPSENNQSIDFLL